MTPYVYPQAGDASGSRLADDVVQQEVDAAIRGVPIHFAPSNPHPVGGLLGQIIERIKARLQTNPNPTQQEAIEQVARKAAHDVGSASEGSYSHTLSDGTKVYENFSTKDGTPVTTHFGPNGEISIFVGDKLAFSSGLRRP